MNVFFIEKTNDFFVFLFTLGAYINKREVTGRFRVKPGNYVLIPSTYEADREGQFLIRIFSEGRSTGKSLNVDTPDHVRRVFFVVLSLVETCSSSFDFQGPPTPTEQREKYEFKDGKGKDPEYSVMQWYEKLPLSQRNLLK